MIIENTIFWIFAILAVVSAIAVVTHRSIVYSALFLIVVFLSIAAVFVLNNADFLAIAQTIIYAVGLTIILLFGVMFTGDRFFQDRSVPKSRLWALCIIALFTLALLITSVSAPGITQVKSPPIAPGLAEMIAREGSTRQLGQLLFSTYSLPFELASILLLVAMIGAIVISKKRALEEDDIAGKTVFLIDSESRPPVEAEEAYQQFLHREALAGHSVEEAVSSQSSSDSANDEVIGVK